MAVCAVTGTAADAVQAEAVAGGASDGELAVGARAAISQGGQCSVGSIAQHSTLGNVDLHLQAACKQLRGLVYHGGTQQGAAGNNALVAAAGGWRGTVAPLALFVACKADALNGLGVILADNLCAVSGADDNGAAVGVELKGHVQWLLVMAVKPHHAIAFCRYYARLPWHRPWPFAISGVADAETAEADGPVGGIVKLQPAVEVEGGTDELVNVGGHHLVDNEGSRFWRAVAHVAVVLQTEVVYHAIVAALARRAPYADGHRTLSLKLYHIIIIEPGLEGGVGAVAVVGVIQAVVHLPAAGALCAHALRVDAHERRCLVAGKECGGYFLRAVTVGGVGVGLSTVESLHAKAIGALGQVLQLLADGARAVVEPHAAGAGTHGAAGAAEGPAAALVVKRCVFYKQLSDVGPLPFGNGCRAQREE